MIKQIKLAFFLFVIILVSGCTHVGTESAEIISTAEGISFDIYADTLQPQQYEGQSFNFQIKVENKGGYSVPADHMNLYLEGINPLTYNLEPSNFIKKNTVELTSLGNFGNETIVRGQEVISFTDLCYKNDLETNLDVNIFLKSCYSYETNAKVSACFGESYSQFNEICTVTEEKAVTNTVAPVKVTQILESPAGQGKYRFIINVENQGSGKVFSRYASSDVADSMSSCRDLNPGLDNIVSIESIKLDGNELMSSALVTIEPNIVDAVANKPYLNLINGAGQFSIVVTDESEGDYVGTLEVVLGYGYSDTKIRSTELVALPNVVPAC